MTAHDPPGKNSGDRGARDIKYATRPESTIMPGEPRRTPSESCSLWDAVCQAATTPLVGPIAARTCDVIPRKRRTSGGPSSVSLAARYVRTAVHA